MIFDQEHVKIHGAVVLWDGITRPDMDTGKAKYSLKVAVHPNNIDLQDMHNLAQATLQSCPFKGNLPNGCSLPGMAVAGPQEYEGLYNGWLVFGCNTQRLPTVYDENGAVMDPMQYGPLIYGGQQVDVLVHCYHYDKAGNRGIATGLDAFSIIVSANAAQQNFGGSGIDTSSAFGGGNNGGQQQNNNNGAPQNNGQSYNQGNNGGQQQNNGGQQQDYNQGNNGGQQQNNGGQQQDYNNGNNGGGNNGQQQSTSYLPGGQQQ